MRKNRASWAIYLQNFRQGASVAFKMATSFRAIQSVNILGCLVTAHTDVSGTDKGFNKCYRVAIVARFKGQDLHAHQRQRISFDEDVLTLDFM